METRDRILAPVATLDASGNVSGANLGALVRRLILFEQVVIDSYGMRELPALIDALGPEQFVQLLESGAVAIRADGWTLGEVGNDTLSTGRTTPLPLLSFSVAPIVPAQEYAKDHISRSLSDVRAMPLGKRTSQRVRQAIVESLTPFPDNPGKLTMDQLPTDLTMRLDLVRAATNWALREYAGRDPEGASYSVQLHEDGPYIFRADTDIGERFSLDEEAVDRVLERAVLAVGNLNERFEMMEAYNAVYGLRENELRLLDAKLSGLLRHVDPDLQEERFTRVLALADLPDPETAEGTINVDRLLHARESEELVEFRQWLRTLDDATEEEIRERITSVRERLAAAVHGTAGRTVRFAATAAADFLPLGGLVVGALDEFLLEKVIPQPGPVSFLGSTYPSLFKT